MDLVRKVEEDDLKFVSPGIQIKITIRYPEMKKKKKKKKQKRKRKASLLLPSADYKEVCRRP
jgi:hypothetical protein